MCRYLISITNKGEEIFRHLIRKVDAETMMQVFFVQKTGVAIYPITY